MATDILVPTLGESVSEATIGRWFKKPGDSVAADEPLVELETDKVTLEVNAPAAGELGEILVKDGETVEPGAVLGSIVDATAGAKKPEPKAAAKEAPKQTAETKAESRSESPKPAEAKAPEGGAGYGNHSEAAPAQQRPVGDNGPAVAKLARESGVDPSPRATCSAPSRRALLRPRRRKPARACPARPPHRTMPPAKSGCG